MPKRIDPALRERPVRLVRDHQEDCPSVTAASVAVAKQLGLGRETVRRWVVQADVDGGSRAGVTSGEQAETRKFKAKVRRLEEDNAIRKSAT